MPASTLLERIQSRQARVAVIGLGYVGLPLAVEFARAGLPTTGIDTDASKVDEVNAGRSYIQDVPGDSLAPLVTSGMLRATADEQVLGESDCVAICVPTPLSRARDPDLSYILSATEAVARYVHPGMLVVLESTTYPGTTEEIVKPRLLKEDVRLGEDFFLAFSPERVDPGNRTWNLRNTPKVVGGVTPACTEAACALYRHVAERVVPVSSAAAAEMVKILENTFRSVNIGLVNEMATICGRLGLDVWEVVEAAATKPFGFMKFTPGPGVGGHCISVDPLYLAWKLRGINYDARFIHLADSINSGMPEYVYDKIADALNHEGKAVRGAGVFVLGVAYKPDVSDARESPALKVMNLLARRGARLAYHDPYVPELELQEAGRLRSSALTPEALARADCLVVLTHHSSLDWGWVGQHARLIVDTRNVIPAGSPAQVVRL